MFEEIQKSSRIWIIKVAQKSSSPDNVGVKESQWEVFRESDPTLTIRILNNHKNDLTDTGEDSKLVHRQKRPKVDPLFSSLFSDASERRV